MSKVALNKKQTDVYNYLIETLSKSIPPTVREICAATGIASTSTVHSILNFLENSGYIVKDPKFSRSIRINSANNSVMVPIMGKITAGNPILAIEEVEEYIPYPITVSEDSEGLFALRVVGLSMKDAGILDGDLIVANRYIVSEAGDIVVALIDDEATVKRFMLENNKPYLKPENPDFDNIYADNIQVLGKVIGVLRRY